MRLVDFDIDIMEELLEMGYRIAIVKPLPFKSLRQKPNVQITMEIVPFKDYDEARRYFDSMQDQELVYSTLVEMSESPFELHISGVDTAHLLIDAELMNLQAA